MSTTAKFTCPCGNHNPKQSHYYDGAAGYEAVICKECGRYYDHLGEHDTDEWSRQYMQPTPAPLLFNGFLIRQEDNGCYSAHNLSTGTYLNPIYKTWVGLKTVLEAMHQVVC